jgi:hypothetical protein
MAFAIATSTFAPALLIKESQKSLVEAWMIPARQRRRECQVVSCSSNIQLPIPVSNMGNPYGP